MFLSDFSLRRPVAILCLIIALTLLGLNSYRKIGLELMPSFDVPYITVTTVYPGATPNDIEVDVAKKIEDAVMTVDGLKNVTSICMENVVQTILEFEIGIDVDVVATDVREKIDLKISQFPSNVEKPVVLKLDINATPIITLALSGEIPVEDLYDYADNELSDRLSRIRGVANVEIIGGSEREVHVELDKFRMAEANITALQVSQALSQGVISIPAGRINQGETEYNVKFNAEFTSIKEIGDIQITGSGGKRVYLKDLGKIRMSNEERRQAAFYNGKEAIVIKLVKRSDANAVEVVRSVREAMDEIRLSLAGGMDLDWFNDNGGFVNATVDSTIINIFFGIILTSVILFFFLFNPRSTLIIGLTMPLTIIVTLFFLNSMGFTLNIITLLAMGLSVGVLVTNSIVVMENVVSKLKKTGNAWNAAKEGTAEVAVAIFASVGTNVVVFLPIGMMSGIVGMIFRPFAWTMLIVNVVSLFLSFTLTPVMSAFLLKKHDEDSRLNRFEEKMNKFLNGKISSFMKFVSPRLSTIVGCFQIVGIAIAVFVFSLFLFTKIGSEFVPYMDQNLVMVTYEFPTRQRIDTTIRLTKQIEERLKGIEGIERSLTTVGKVDATLGQSSDGVYVAQTLLRFKDLSERDFRINDVLDEIRKLVSDVPGAIISVSIPSVMGGQELPIELDIYGDDLVELEKISRKIKSEADNIPGFLEPDISVKEGKTEINVIPDRPVLSDLGISPVVLGSILRSNIEGIESGIFKSGDRSYDIIVKMEKEDNKDQVEQTLFSNPAIKSLSLGGFAEIVEKTAPVKIIRANKRRTVKLYSNLDKSLSLGNAVKLLENSITEKNILPPGYSIKWRGNYERMAEAGSEFIEAAILAILLTFLTLAAILESFIKPVFIMLTLPLGLAGIAFALFLTGTNITIFVMLGALMLIGIVVNNAVLIFERMHVLIDQGLAPGKAMIEAIHDEFRPVLMITLAAVLGMVPLAVATGMGSELTTGIGIASIGGIIVSSFLTLIIIPAFYEIYLKLANRKNH